jgi:CubicO group peptidase (beta-lactamase class C family)
VPTTTPAGLSTLPFSDPHHVSGWRHAVIPATDALPLPSDQGADPAGPAVEVAGGGRSRGLAAWVEETWSTSLLLEAGGRVVHEWYAEDHGPGTLFLGASMTKSVLAHLVGRAVREGALRITDAVTTHVPELAGSGYDGTSVLHLLTMTTGVDWVEDHRDPAGRATRLLACFLAAGDSRALLAEVPPAAVPGTRFGYCTADSQVLDWVRERATGAAYPDDAARLWRDLGCTQDAVVALDGAGVALAGGGLAATTRDWAKVAHLAVAGVSDGGERLLDPGWVDAAARPEYPFLGVGRLPSTITAHAGFGYHWWPLDDAGRRVTADGSRGQLAAADRRTGSVVVKTSLWPYDDAWADRQHRDLSYLGLHALLDATDPAHRPTRGETRP